MLSRRVLIICTHVDVETKQSNASPLAVLSVVASLDPVLCSPYYYFAKFLQWCVRKCTNSI